jgi:hypothetical protein
MVIEPTEGWSNGLQNSIVVCRVEWSEEIVKDHSFLGEAV